MATRRSNASAAPLRCRAPAVGRSGNARIPKLLHGLPTGAQDVCKLSSAAAEPLVAVIDGPYDARALSGVLAGEPLSVGYGRCAATAGSACSHGTLIIGLLGARRDALIPGLCPNCRLLHIPLFMDENAPRASVVELARAISLAVASGARLINLSLAIEDEAGTSNPELAAALDQAHASDVVVMAAAGNTSRVALGQLLSHPTTIPVMAVDAAGRPLPDCNLGPLISRRGVAAFGGGVSGYAPGGGTTVMSGASVATAIATGTLAQVWSARADLGAAKIRAAVARVGPRDGRIPPMLNRDLLVAALDEPDVPAASSRFGRGKMNHVVLQGRAPMQERDGHPDRRDSGSTVPSGRVIASATDANGCACGAPSGACSCASGDTNFVYVLGSVDIRFPDQSIFEELNSEVARIARGQKPDKSGKKEIEQREDEDLRSWYFRVLSHRSVRYVARQVCWILEVEGQPAYYLCLRDSHDLDELIGYLGHAAVDLDLFVGTSSLTSVETCSGVVAPVLTVDHLRSIDQRQLIEWFEAALKTPAKKPTGRKSAPSQEPNPEPQGPMDLFKMLVQSADNFGDTDSWRALNCLASTYRDLYEGCAEMARDGYALDSVKVVVSRLWRQEKRIVDPVFAFRHWKTGVIKRKFVRVDVSHLFPMIANPISDYVDR